MKVGMKDVQEDFKRYQAEIDELKADYAKEREVNLSLKDVAKRAFWWASEFTATVHNNKIQAAWEDFTKIESAKLKDRLGSNK